jgi:hypothetical protein
MATTYSERVPTWFWIVSGLALLWEAMGCYAYLAQSSMDAAQLAALPEAQQQLMSNVPAWVTAAFALATWGGLAGAIGLLLRRTWARALFIVSLVAALVQFGWWFLIAGAAAVIGPSAYAMPATVIVVAVLLVWFATMAIRRGWLR